MRKNGNNWLALVDLTFISTLLLKTKKKGLNFPSREMTAMVLYKIFSKIPFGKFHSLLFFVCYVIDTLMKAL